MSTLNRRWCLAEVDAANDLSGLSLSREHFVYDEVPVPKPADGELLIRSAYFSPDPMNHAWARGLAGRFEAIPTGSPHRGGVAGIVEASRHPDFKPGDRVTGFLEWADYNLSRGSDLLDTPLQPVPDDLPLASGLSALGMTGLCAWLGLSQIGQPIPEDTVVVSGASGAIGSLAGQIASLYGTRVIGTARGAEKCQFASELGFDAAIDQSQADWPTQLTQLAPNGVDVFFDNVGGEVLDTLLTQINPSGRIVVCGATAHYSPGAAISNHMMLAVTGCTMKGFFYFDYQPYWAQARQRMAQLLSRGAIQDPLDITEGFDRVPEAALGQFQSANFGRKLIQVN